MSFLLKLMGMKLRATRPVEGSKITVVFNDEEAKFMYEYFDTSLDIANYNDNIPNALMLKGLMNKVFNGMYTELKTSSDMENGKYREFEVGGEFSA
jgi:hypothetical protein